MIAIPQQTIDQEPESDIPHIEQLPAGETKSMKVITIRTIETPAGVGYHLTVMEDVYTLSQAMTPAQLGDYLHQQGDAHRASGPILDSALAARRRRRQRGAA